MISLELLIALVIGTVAVSVPILIQAAWYKIKPWKGIVIALLGAIVGTVGTRIWFWIENRRFGGQSFFGAVFLVPIVFLLVARVLHLPYGVLMDLCGPAECIMLVIMKIQCMRVGCCRGIDLIFNEYGIITPFPSQLVELIAALAIFIVLMVLSRKNAKRGAIYPWYMVIYGALRFALNFLRADRSPFALGLPAGSFWALCAFLIGFAVLILMKKKSIKVPEGK